MVAVTILLSKYTILYDNVVVTIQSIARRWTTMFHTKREGDIPQGSMPPPPPTKRLGSLIDYYVGINIVG